MRHASGVKEKMSGHDIQLEYAEYGRLRGTHHGQLLQLRGGGTRDSILVRRIPVGWKSRAKKPTLQQVDAGIPCIGSAEKGPLFSPRKRLVLVRLGRVCGGRIQFGFDGGSASISANPEALSWPFSARKSAPRILLRVTRASSSSAESSAKTSPSCCVGR